MSTPNQDGGHPRIQCSCLTARRPSRLSKRFHLDAQEQLVKQGGGQLVAGEAQRLALGSLVELAALLPQLTPGQALAYGVPAHETARVVTHDALRRVHESAGSFGKATDGVPVIARDREHFQWPAGPGILMLDYDPPEGADPLSPPRFREALYEAWPALRAAPHLWRPSAGGQVAGNLEFAISGTPAA